MNCKDRDATTVFSGLNLILVLWKQKAAEFFKVGPKKEPKQLPLTNSVRVVADYTWNYVASVSI